MLHIYIYIYAISRLRVNYMRHDGHLCRREWASGRQCGGYWETEKRTGVQTSPALPSVTASKVGLAKGKTLQNEKGIVVGSVYAPEEKGVKSSCILTRQNPVFTICTTSWTCNISSFCPHTVFTSMCFVWIWEPIAIISIYSINWPVFVTETECLLRGTDWILMYNLG